MKNLKNKLERAHRPDRYFAVASIAVMIFMMVAAWMFGQQILRPTGTAFGAGSVFFRHKLHSL